jgi:hypothetical protein
MQSAAFKASFAFRYVLRELGMLIRADGCRVLFAEIHACVVRR